jgi:hypothetical protein
MKPVQTLALVALVVRSVAGGNNPISSPRGAGGDGVARRTLWLLVVATAGLWRGGYRLGMNNGGGPRVSLAPRQRSA